DGIRAFHVTGVQTCALPILMTFSFRPISESLRALIAASVSTRVVSWNDAADSQDSVANEALVIPISTGRPAAGSPPSATTRRFSDRKSGVERKGAVHGRGRR